MVIIIMWCILPLLCASRVMNTNAQVASHVKSEFPFRSAVCASKLYHHWHVLSVAQSSFYGTIVKKEDKQRYGNTITYTYTVGVNGRKFAARIPLLNVSVLSSPSPLVQAYEICTIKYFERGIICWSSLGT